MSDRNIEKRREERYPACKKIEYALSESPAITFQGILANISKSGICLHLYNMLDKGKSITLRSGLDNSCQKATLKWIKELDDGLYMAGFGCQ